MSANRPAFIGVDWGTSAFRAYLANAQGQALEVVSSAVGALSLQQGEHEAFLSRMAGGWLQCHGALPVLISGMAGARQGWLEVPYVPCPAGLPRLVRAMGAIETCLLGRIGIIPGLSTLDAVGAPDVMRGEETQIFGALAASGAQSGYFVLPGTHSKWATVEGRQINAFASFMTGEVFAALKNHTILGALMQGETAPGSGFEQGVSAAAGLRDPGDLLHSIFAARSLGLFDRLAPDQLSGYLSGLLIGAELLSNLGKTKRAIVIATSELTQRYCNAARRLGFELTAAPENCALLGQAAMLGPWLEAKPSFAAVQHLC